MRLFLFIIMCSVLGCEDSAPGVAGVATCEQNTTICRTDQVCEPQGTRGYVCVDMTDPDSSYPPLEDAAQPYDSTTTVIDSGAIDAFVADTLETDVLSVDSSITDGGGIRILDSAVEADMRMADAAIGPRERCTVLVGRAVNDIFGASVKLNRSGDRLVVGAYQQLGDVRLAGYVRAYGRTGDEWAQMGDDINGMADGHGAGYSTAMSADGDRVVIGSPIADDYTGLARVFQLNNGSWEQMGATIQAVRAGSQFGGAVAMNADGDRIAVGWTDNLASASYVQLYDWQGGAWATVGDVVQVPGFRGLTSGALSFNDAGNRLSVGLIGSVAGNGGTQIFQLSDGVWTPMGDIVQSGLDGLDQFGYCTSLNAAGDRVAIGARFDSTAAAQAGALRIYEWNGATWIQLGDSLLGMEFGQLGQSCELSDQGDRVVSGQPNGAGFVQAYVWQDDQWDHLGEQITDDRGGNLGHAVAISGDGQYVVGGGPLAAENYVTVCRVP